MKYFFNERLLWAIIILAIGGVAAYYSFITSSQIFNYIKLNKKTQAEITKWEIKEIDDEKFVLSAQYSYAVKGIILKGQTTFYNEKYLNLPAALEALKEKENDSYEAWYRGYGKRNSSLTKIFPTKNLIYTIVIITLLLYFCFLKFYVVRFKKTN